MAWASTTNRARYATAVGLPLRRTRAAMRRRGFLGREDKTGMVALSALGKKVAGYIAKGEL